MPTPEWMGRREQRSGPAPPMTTVLLSENFPPKVGGSGRWFWEVYRRLPRHEVRILAGEDARQKEYDAGHDLPIDRVPLTFPTRFVRPSSLGHYRRAYRALHEAVRSAPAPRVHCGRPVPEGLLGLTVGWRTGVAFTCYAHGEDVNLSNSETTPGRLARRVYGSRELAQLVGLVLRGADLLIANSDNTRSILTDRWQLPPDRVQVLHPGVDTNEFRPAPADARVRERLGWADRPVVLTVGRLQRRKGQDVVIRALAEVRQAVPRVLYAVVGDGEELPRLRRLAREQGVEEHVLFMGEVADRELIDCYQQCDLFVLANREIDGDIEGFGMVLLEAQACGKPVVAGSSGGTAETMRLGRTGVVVPCSEPGPLAAEVAGLLSDDGRRQTMGGEAREWVVSRFDWQAVSRRAAELFGLTESPS